MIHILLASYNGERFIEEQIDSLLNQTIQDFKIFISDDKSTDSTYSIIQEYVRKYPDKIFATQNQVNTGSPKYNFIKLMIENKSDYIMLCDQDDIWLPDKIEKSLYKVQEMEKLYGTDMPILAHSDLKVVDENLQTIAESFVASINIDCKKISLNSLIVQNVLTGCTAIYNRALSYLITSEPKYMMMHDWWLMLVASAFGKIGIIYEPTILYRQHSRNNIGAKKVGSLKYIAHKILNFQEMRSSINDTYKQAESFLDIYSDKLKENDKFLLKKYISVPKMKKFQRVRSIYELKTFKNGLGRRIAHFWIV